MSDTKSLAFGLVVTAGGGVLGERVDALVRRAGERGLDLRRHDAASYEALANDVREGAVDIAWLPPIVFVQLGDAVTPLGRISRDGQSAFEAALIVRADSKVRTVDGLRGTRAGWVDRWSAAGFVLPRVKLALSGVDPRTLFRTETFHGSHRAAIKALLEGACDVAGTYARSDEEGKVVAGAWSEVDGAADIRVLTTFGAIPPDVIAVRRGVDQELSDRVLAGLQEMCANAKDKPLVREIFGGDELALGLAPGYDALKSALQMASTRGLFD